MAVITTPARLNFGSFSPRQAQIFNTVGFNLTTSSGGIAFPFIAEKTMTVTDIGAVMTGISTTVAGALDIGIMADNGSGLPSGTFLTTGSITLPANTWTLTGQFTASSGNTLMNTTSNHYLKVGDIVRFTNTTGGVAINTDYFVATVPNANQVTLSTSSTLSPIFSFTASVTPGANTFVFQPLWTRCAGITASITQGTAYWLVYQWTGTSTGQCFFNAGDTGGASGQSVQYGIGYATRSAGTWAKVSTTRGIPVMYTDGTNWYGTPQMAGPRVASTTLNNNDRGGFRFTVPANHPDILIDRIVFPTHPSASPGTGSNWKAQLFTDAGAGTPTFVSDLSVIAGDAMGNATGGGNFASTIFQTNGSTWLTAGSSYLIMVGFDVSPASGNPTVNYYSGQVLTGRNGVVGPFGGDYVLNWQGAGTWFTTNPDTYAPWSITSAALRYNDSGSGGGGFANASTGFAGIGGN